MEDEDFEVEQMMKRHKKAGGILLGNGTIRDGRGSRKEVVSRRWPERARKWYPVVLG